MPPDASPSTPAYARMRDVLRAEILDGGWQPGEHRTLSALAGRYRVSISPVREALLGLEGEGLVEMRQHRGAVVPILDAAMLEGLYDLRGALQSLLARRTAERAAPEVLAILTEADAGYRDAARRGDAEAAIRHNDTFHEAIELGAGNAQASAVYRARSAFVNTARLRLGFGPNRMEEAAEQHGAILHAIAARDAEGAAAAAFAHAMAAKRDLIARLNDEKAREGNDT
ncbi:GntR family transcriptional regulator [Roseomonas sp. CCTCC AB2023176]|uniref:GntR family transcriptional regulator n=1 Tax=Roseomonas sp. CCTCC AB2023176 TaxID=3342640 RepID=UPI0035E0454D